MARDLEALCPGGVLQDVPLDQISRWRIGGKAALVVRPSNPDELAAIRRYFAQTGTPHTVIGDTSNLLFADEGLQVPCIQIGQRMSALRIQDNCVEAEAGIWVPHLARKLMQAGLSGAEHVCGIPGTLGGLVCMNGGSQRKGIGSRTVRVASIDATGAQIVRNATDCGFAYRQSVYQQNGEAIASVCLQFDERKPPSEIRTEMLAILRERRLKFPRKLPNCGSVFKSNPAMYAEVGPPGAVIERLGFKGLMVGGALVSPLHANFIVNTGDARARDVLTLVNRISQEVFAATGYRMEAEAFYIHPDGRMQPTDTACDRYAT